MPDLAGISTRSALPADVTGTVVTVGTFDGVHRGHADVISRLSDRAKAAGMASLLVSFDPHPLEVVNPESAPRLLTTQTEKLEVLATTGLDYYCIVPFTSRLAAYTAAEFVDTILRRRFRMRELLIGHDHGLGRRRSGNVVVLRELGKRWDFPVDVIDPVSLDDGQHVSSTSVRRAVAGGDLTRAAAGLGRPYSVSGTVIAGHARGRELGFATLNLSPPPPRKLLPPDGVYAVRVQTPRGEYQAMLNLGPRPTFGEVHRSIEAHMFDASGDFYGVMVRVDFIAFLRETRKFESASELIAQLERDREHAMRALTLFTHAGNLRGSMGTANFTPPEA